MLCVCVPYSYHKWEVRSCVQCGFEASRRRFLVKIKKTWEHTCSDTRDTHTQIHTRTRTHKTDIEFNYF